MSRQGTPGPAVGQSLVDGKVEPFVAVLHLGPIERAAPTRGRDPSASRALPGLVLDTVLVEERVDAGVRRGFERLLPARGCPAAASCFFTPAPHELSLFLRARLLED